MCIFLSSIHNSYCRQISFLTSNVHIKISVCCLSHSNMICATYMLCTYKIANYLYTLFSKNLVLSLHCVADWQFLGNMW